MVPRRAMLTATANAIAADTSDLGAATPFVCVALVAAPFTPALDLSMGVVTLASFVGSAPIHAANATPQVGTDPANGDQIIQPQPPVGGWRFEASSATGLPETIYGFLILDSAETTIIMSALLDAPVTISQIGDFVDIPPAQVSARLSTTAIS